MIDLSSGAVTRILGAVQDPAARAALAETLALAAGPDRDLPESICAALRGHLAAPDAFSPATPSDMDLLALNVRLRGDDLPPAVLADLASQPWIARLDSRSLAQGAERMSAVDADAAWRLLGAAAVRATDINAVSRVRRAARNLAPRQDAGAPRLRVAVAGNCTLKSLAETIEVALLGQGVAATVWEAPFDQWAAQLVEPNSELWQFEPSVVVLYLSSLGLTSAATHFSQDAAALAQSAVAAARRRAPAQIVVVLPEPLEEGRYAEQSGAGWHTAFIERLRHGLDERVVFVDPASVIAEVGASRWFAPRYWYHGKIPCHPDGLAALGRRVGLTLARLAASPVKLIAVDLDQFLWGGIVGEDGWQGLDLDVHGSGAAYVRVQALLKEAASRGILLAAISKNNRDDVREVFDRRDDMLLRWDDFSAVVANWQPKSEGLAQIARTLNIGLQHICFLDDSPFERAEVRHALPEVIVPELPGNPEDVVGALLETGLFHVPAVTDEDLSRAQLYRVEAQRAEALESAGADGFLGTLGLVVSPHRVDDAILDRVTQLVSKTNQFNLRTIRHDAARLRRFAADPDVYAHAYRVRDRFGDSGLVGVLIAEPTGEAGTYRIDTWLLSCRVMGRTVEHAMFEHLLDWLGSRGVRRLVGEYVPTAKNAPVADLYPRLGFAAAAGGSHQYARDVAGAFDGNRFVAIDRDAEAQPR